MTIFQFLRLLQSALCSGLFTRRRNGAYSAKFRYELRDEAACRALGVPEHRLGDEFCPITIVSLFLGHGFHTTGDYETAAAPLGIPRDVREFIVSTADVESYENDMQSGEPLYETRQAPRRTLEAIATATQAVPRGWSCAG